MLNLSKSILSIQSNIQSEKLCFYLVQREEIHSVLRYFVPHIYLFHFQSSRELNDQRSSNKIERTAND